MSLMIKYLVMAGGIPITGECAPESMAAVVLVHYPDDHVTFLPQA